MSGIRTTLILRQPAVSSLVWPNRTEPVELTDSANLTVHFGSVRSDPLSRIPCARAWPADSPTASQCVATATWHCVGLVGCDEHCTVHSVRERMPLALCAFRLLDENEQLKLK